MKRIVRKMSAHHIRFSEQEFIAEVHVKITLNMLTSRINIYSSGPDGD